MFLIILSQKQLRSWSSVGHRLSCTFQDIATKSLTWGAGHRKHGLPKAGKKDCRALYGVAPASEFPKDLLYLSQCKAKLAHGHSISWGRIFLICMVIILHMWSLALCRSCSWLTDTHWSRGTVLYSSVGSLHNLDVRAIPEAHKAKVPILNCLFTICTLASWILQILPQNYACGDTAYGSTLQRTLWHWAKMGDSVTYGHQGWQSTFLFPNFIKALGPAHDRSRGVHLSKNISSLHQFGQTEQLTICHWNTYHLPQSHWLGLNLPGLYLYLPWTFQKTPAMV